MMYREALLRAAVVCESEKDWAGSCRLYAICGDKELLLQASAALGESDEKELRQLGRWLAREVRSSEPFSRKFPKIQAVSEEGRITIQLLFVKRYLEQCCAPSLLTDEERAAILERARNLFQELLSVMLRLDPLVYCEIQCGLAEGLLKLGYPEEARIAVGEALRIKRVEGDEFGSQSLQSPIRARAYRQLGNYFSGVGRLSLAIKARKLEMAMLEEAVDLGVSEFIVEKAILLSLGCSELLDLSRCQEALAWSNCAVDYFKEHDGSYLQNLFYIQAVSKGGVALCCLDETESGLQRVSVSIELWEELERKAPNTCLEHMAWACFFLGRFAIQDFPNHVQGRLHLKKSVFLYAKLAATEVDPRVRPVDGQTKR